MKRWMFVVGFVPFLFSQQLAVVAQVGTAGEQKSEAKNVFSIVGTNDRILAAAKGLFDSFPTESKVKKPFGSIERKKWTNLPVGIVPRNGVSIGEMTIEQRRKTHRFLSEILSSQGYLKATGIMRLDSFIDQQRDAARLKWHQKNYYLSFFGDPNKEKRWTMKFEGHHLTIHFTYNDGKMSATPFFVGTDPAEVRTTEYAGWRILGKEEDLGFRLVNSLREEQQKKAILSKRVPRDILTGPTSQGRLKDYQGIAWKEMDEKQRKIFARLIREFVGNLEHDQAEIELKKIMAAGPEKIHFAWIGDHQKNSSYYYVVNGPTFLLEFDNPRNHVHAIWRSKDNDYGQDILKHHHRSENHSGK